MGKRVSEPICPLCGGTVDQMGLNHVTQNRAHLSEETNLFAYRFNRLQAAAERAKAVLDRRGTPPWAVIEWDVELKLLLDEVQTIAGTNRKMR